MDYGEAIELTERLLRRGEHDVVELLSATTGNDSDFLFAASDAAGGLGRQEAATLLEDAGVAALRTRTRVASLGVDSDSHRINQSDRPVTVSANAALEYADDPYGGAGIGPALMVVAAKALEMAGLPHIADDLAEEVQASAVGGISELGIAAIVERYVNLVDYEV